MRTEWGLGFESKDFKALELHKCLRGGGNQYFFSLGSKLCNMYFVQTKITCSYSPTHTPLILGDPLVHIMVVSPVELLKTFFKNIPYYFVKEIWFVEKNSNGSWFSDWNQLNMLQIFRDTRLHFSHAHLFLFSINSSRAHGLSRSTRTCSAWQQSAQCSATCNAR